MAYKKITELPEATSAVDSDLLVIETQGGTKKIKKENLVFDTTVDPVPTPGSDNAVSSGGVYDALQEKMDDIDIDPAPIENSSNLVTSGGVYSAFELFDRNVILTETLLAGNTTLVFTDDHLADDNLINVFTDDPEVFLITAESDKQTKTLTLTFDAYPDDHEITVKLETARYENYEGKPF